MAYFLRTTSANGHSYHGFRWPREVGAIVKAPDWEPTKECGNGLHGMRDGIGDSWYLSSSPSALWWIVEADDAECIDLDGKWKFPRCTVIAVGDRATVTQALYALRPGPINGLMMTVGDRSTLTGGDGSILTGGGKSTLIGGKWSMLTGGEESTLTGGYGSTLIFTRWLFSHLRVLTAYVGEDGIKPGVAYRANDDHTAVVEATQ